MYTQGTTMLKNQTGSQSSTSKSSLRANNARQAKEGGLMSEKITETTEPTEPEEVRAEEVEAEETEETEETEEKGKRGRKPITHADIMARVAHPTPYDEEFLNFASETYNLFALNKEKTSRTAEETALALRVYILGRNSKVHALFTASDFWNNAGTRVAELAEAQAAAIRDAAIAKKLEEVPGLAVAWAVMPEDARAAVVRSWGL